MQIQIKNDLDEMSRLREMVQMFSLKNQLSEEAVFAIDLFLEELITNIIKYGFKDDNDHLIEIDLSLEKDTLVLEIRDDGHPFDPTRIPEPNLDAPLEERQIGGLGIHLVRNYADSMNYKREKNQNITTVKKRL